jgi:hypothetical protein
MIKAGSQKDRRKAKGGNPSQRRGKDGPLRKKEIELKREMRWRAEERKTRSGLIAIQGIVRE